MQILFTAYRPCTATPRYFGLHLLLCIDAVMSAAQLNTVDKSCALKSAGYFVLCDKKPYQKTSNIIKQFQK